MKSLLLWAVMLTAFISCKSKKVNFTHATYIASVTYKSEYDYLNKTIADYSKLSDSGDYFGKQNSILDEKILELKKQFEAEGNVSSQLQDTFFNYFEPLLKTNTSNFESQNIEELKKARIENKSDIDLIGLYFKRSIVSKLNDNKLLPFDTWSVMATVDKWKIKNGEEFRMQMNTTASNSKQQAEWYIVKDGSKGLTKDNISDTLYPGEFGETIFKTTQYHKGENQIPIIVKLKTINGEQIVAKIIAFTVE